MEISSFNQWPFPLDVGLQACNIQALVEEIISSPIWQSFLSDATFVAEAMGIEPKLDCKQRKRKYFLDEADVKIYYLKSFSGTRYILSRI